MPKQKEIKFIENSLEAVRKLPDVYIGALGNQGFINMYREVFQNSCDVIIKGLTLDKSISVSYDERTHMVVVEDNGPGIPCEVVSKVFSVLHSSSNYDKQEGSGEYSAGKNGMGATITNYLSKSFIVESYREDGSAIRVEFIEGELKSEKSIKKNKQSKNHGLVTMFEPSGMMGEITVTAETLYALTWNICHLCSIGTKVVFNSIDLKGKPSIRVIENIGGIAEMLPTICQHTNIKPISFGADDGTRKIEVLFAYDTKTMDSDPKILGFVNMCPANGTHVDGFRNAIEKYFKKYMNTIFLANNKKKLTVTNQDIRTGLCAIVNGYHIAPMFTGQSKETFSKEDMLAFVEKVTMNALAKWAAENPTDLQKVCKYLKEICEIRSKMDDSKIKMSYTASVLPGNLPDKYRKPNGKKDLELWIVEGDSAAGGLENNRDKSCQGIFPIKGKLINALVKPTKAFFENEEVAGIFKILGYNGYSRKFDPELLRKSGYTKVVIATDADFDGYHIRTLVFSLFLRYLPFVIEQGLLYAANPPLYSVKDGKKKIFIADDREYIEYVQDKFKQENSICNAKTGKPYTKKEITQILYKNRYYAASLESVASINALDPFLLEFIVDNMDLPADKLAKAIAKQYKYMKNISVSNNVYVIEGEVSDKRQYVILNNTLFEMCKPLQQILKNSERVYIVNGVKTTLYGLMHLFNGFEPKNVTRYKGLGEMNPLDLAESTVLPNHGRILRQYTITDAKKELEILTDVQSDKIAFLDGVKIRKEDIV